DLPDDIRARMLTGAPRSSHEIPGNPFGVHTTLLMERNRADARVQNELVAAVVEGGYKWVADYISGHAALTSPIEEIPDIVEPLLPPMIQYAALLRAYDVNLIIRVDFPNWSAGIQRAMTDDDRARMRVFVAPIVRALSPYCRHWQYYNEPNIGNENPRAEPEAYVDWLRFFRALVLEVQPDAIVAGPAPSMMQCMTEKPYPWLRLAFEAGMAEHLDMFTYHPYRQFYWVANIPEHASEFHPWEHWGSYYAQVEDLKGMIRRANGGRDLPLAITEDGMPNDIAATGEQEITWIIGAKYELRRMLLDHWVGVDPRATFILFRDIPSQFYEKEASFNMVTRDMDKKPAWYAAQNLNAVLDDTYARNDGIDLNLELDEPPAEGTGRMIRTEADAAGMKPGGMEGLYVQTYTKLHPDFDELLIFFWSAEPAGDRHARRKAVLTLRDPEWMAPLEIDLIAMPNPRLAVKQAGRDDLINPECPDRLQPRPLHAELKDGVIFLPVEARDYPLLIKWVRPTR
ncbi:MAG: hypothetical protein JXB13_01175, partial [Phycisphaerae bacterium]|nr:hypothetical protein [Phycisphaerae bacterium]